MYRIIPFRVLSRTPGVNIEMKKLKTCLKIIKFNK